MYRYAQGRKVPTVRNNHPQQQSSQANPCKWHRSRIERYKSASQRVHAFIASEIFRVRLGYSPVAEPVRETARTGRWKTWPKAFASITKCRTVTTMLFLRRRATHSNAHTHTHRKVNRYPAPDGTRRSSWGECSRAAHHARFRARARLCGITTTLFPGVASSPQRREK